MERLPYYLRRKAQENHPIMAAGQRPGGKLQQAYDESTLGSPYPRIQLDKCSASISVCLQVHTTQYHDLYAILPPIWTRTANQATRD